MCLSVYGTLDSGGVKLASTNYVRSLMLFWIPFWINAKSIIVTAISYIGYASFQWYQSDEPEWGRLR